MKPYNFKVYDEPLQNYLDIQSDLSEFIRNILDDYRTGKIVSKLSINFDEEMNTQKLKKIKKENIKLDLDNRIKLIRDLGFSPNDALDIANGTKTIDENAVHCPDCTWFTNSKDSTNFQINSLVTHMKIEHKRNLTEKEAEELTRLLI